VCSPSLQVPEKVIIHEPPELKNSGKFKPLLEILNATNFSPVCFLIIKSSPSPDIDLEQ
jgi:hypothetical protein